VRTHHERGGGVHEILFEPDMPDISPDVRGVITAVLCKDGKTSDRFFDHPRLGEVYRAYVIAGVLDLESNPGSSAEDLPAGRAARVLSSFRLTGEGSENWTQLYEHTGGVVAAAVTIARRMRLPVRDAEHIRSAALLHDATKRVDIERFQVLANSLEHTNHRLRQTMQEAGFSAVTISAAMNTGREDRKFNSAVSRWRSIRSKGVVPAVVGLADARTIGAEFRSLESALEYYLGRKKDAESQEFFARHWVPYYRAVEDYLKEQCSGLDLRISSKDIYNETIFPEVFGSRPSRAIRERYRYSE
jgi:hypothetical protein